MGVPGELPFALNDKIASVSSIRRVGVYFVASGLAGVGETSVTYPLDVSRLLQQSGGFIFLFGFYRVMEDQLFLKCNR